MNGVRKLLVRADEFPGPGRTENCYSQGQVVSDRQRDAGLPHSRVKRTGQASFPE
jgi:hypothetical protein